jgi:hypothetical protein
MQQHGDGAPEPPALWVSRAALVMKVRPPERGEPPSSSVFRNSTTSQLTMKSGRIAAPRADLMAGPSGSYIGIPLNIDARNGGHNVNEGGPSNLV